MNAPLRSDAVSLPLAPVLATFRVRQRTAGTWDVVREISGPDVLSVEESPLRIGDLHRDPVEANAAAAAAAEAWKQSGRAASVKRFPIVGERPTGGRLVGPVTAAQFAAASLMRRRREHISPDDPERVEQAERHLDFLRRAS